MRESPAVVAAFLEGFLRDRQDGSTRSRSDYQRRFPGHEELIGREFDQLVDHPADASDVEAERAPAEKTFGPYRIERELGHGGQGTVYLATDTRLRRRVALKVLSGFSRVSPVLLDRFKREAEVASRLDHKGICTVFEYGVIDDTPYVAMRFVEGRSLAGVIADQVRESGDAAPSRAELVARLRLIENAARALHYAHEAGVIHRDIKPGNIMVAQDGEPVLLDFGLARDLEDDAVTLTQSGDFFGSPAYMSPEQIEGGGRATDRRSDVYALGITLYELITGRRPFDAPTHEGLFHAILTRRIPDPRRESSAVPSDLSVVLETATAKEPGQRYSTALDLAEDLAAIAETRPIRAVSPSTVVRMVRWARREPAKALLMLALATTSLGLATLGGYLLATTAIRQAGEEELEQRRIDQMIHDLVNVRGFVVSDELSRAIVAHPEVPFLRVVKGIAYLEQRRPGHALDLLDDAPGDARAQAAFARLRLLSRGWMGEDVEEELRTLGDPTDPLEWYVTGAVSLRRFKREGGDHARNAVHQLRRAVMLAPQPNQLYAVDLSRACLAADDERAAHEVFDVLEKYWPTSFKAMFDVGRALQKSDPARAIRAFDRTLRASPEMSQARLGRAICLLRIGRVDEAEPEFADIVEQRRERSDLWLYFFQYGSAALEVGQTGIAVRSLERAVEISEGEAVCHATLGDALAERGLIGEAGASFGAALEALDRAPDDDIELRSRIESARSALRPPSEPAHD